jgi:hypothetical protein
VIKGREAEILSPFLGPEFLQPPCKSLKSQGRNAALFTAPAAENRAYFQLGKLLLYH